MNLDKKPPVSWIERRGSIVLQTRSPELISLDIIMWSYVKYYVFSVQMKFLSHMYEVSEYAIVAVSTLSWKTVENTYYRIDQTIRVNGGHIEQQNKTFLEYLYYNT